MGKALASEMVKLIETTTVPIFGVDSTGLVNGWNEKIAELIGLEAHEALGESLVDELVHEDSRRAVGNILSELPIRTETDKIRSTPLSGFKLQTSLMEAAILMQTFLSDLNSAKPFGSNIPLM